LNTVFCYAPSTVQVSNTTLQLADVYKFDPNADYVLVISSATLADEIAQWTRAAALVGSRISIWNVSLYGGFDFSFVRSDGGSLAAELPGRVLIFLNRRYEIDATRSRAILEDDLLIEELYDVARRPLRMPADIVASGKNSANVAPAPEQVTEPIHALVVTDATQSAWDPFAFHGLRAHPDTVDIPQAQGESDVTTSPRSEDARPPAGSVRLHATHREPESVRTPRIKLGGCFSSPEPHEQHLQTAASDAARELHGVLPTEQHVVLHHFSPATDGSAGCGSATVTLGSLRVFRGLSTAVAQIGVTHPGRSDAQLAYAACKLLPFERKLARLAKIHTDAAAAGPVTSTTAVTDALVSCLLSDLADEQWAWRQHKWSGEWPRERLAGAVTIVRTLATSESVERLFATDGGRNALIRLLSQYCALLDVLPSLADRMWFYR
jgi:hypothetical protein